MKGGPGADLYVAFGRLVRLHRKRLDGMTQEQLGRRVGLSRPSVANIERGRQNVALHQIFAIAEALRVQPATLLPSVVGRTDNSHIADALPPGTDTEIADWAGKLLRESAGESR